MSKRRRHAEKPPSQSAVSSPRAQGPAKTQNAPGSRNTVSKGRRALYRLLTVLLAPIIFLAVLELALRVCGYGYSTSFFIKIKGADALTTNPKFGWRYSPREIATTPYPVILSPHKAPGTKRVFILGESAAQGTPIPAFGFSRILGVMLQQQYPSNQIEVVNVAMRGINSHAIVPIARECASLEPDLFLIYMGNNEAIGLHAPKPGQLSPPLWMLQTGQCLKDSKVGQLLTACLRSLRKSEARPQQDMAFFRKYSLAADDSRRQAVYRNFQANLDSILRATRNSGAKVLLCTVAANMADFPPLVSLHRAKLAPSELSQWENFYQQAIAAEAANNLSVAVTNFAKAVELDDHYAELHFRLARCYAGLGQMDLARKEFILARDWDALQFRTDGPLNTIIRNAVKKYPGIALDDVEEVFNQHQFRNPGAVTPRLFHEHVHFTFDGDYLLAQTVLAPLSGALGLSAPGTPPLPARPECAAALGLSEFDEINMARLTAAMTAKPPFLDQLDHAQRQMQRESEVQVRHQTFQMQQGWNRAFEVYRAALARRPNDWQIHMGFAVLLNSVGQSSEIAAQAAETAAKSAEAQSRAAEANAKHAEAAAQYAQARAKYTESSAEYETAVKHMPVYPSLRALYSQSLLKLGKRQEAIQQLEQILQFDPGNRTAMQGLATLR